MIYFAVVCASHVKMARVKTFQRDMAGSSRAKQVGLRGQLDAEGLPNLGPTYSKASLLNASAEFARAQWHLATFHLTNVSSGECCMRSLSVADGGKFDIARPFPLV